MQQRELFAAARGLRPLDDLPHLVPGEDAGGALVGLVVDLVKERAVAPLAGHRDDALPVADAHQVAAPTNARLADLFLL